jgi:acyl carrier protein
MEEKKIRRNLYRVLRKTGVQKQDIQLEASFREDLQFDTVDWTIFTYYLEGVLDIAIKDEDLVKLNNVNNTIHYLGHTA